LVDHNIIIDIEVNTVVVDSLEIELGVVNMHSFIVDCFLNFSYSHNTKELYQVNFEAYPKVFNIFLMIQRLIIHYLNLIEYLQSKVGCLFWAGGGGCLYTPSYL
jgi:hypothetical protein